MSISLTGAHTLGKLTSFLKVALLVLALHTLTGCAATAPNGTAFVSPGAAPQIASVTPSYVIAGSGTTALQIQGANFSPAATVLVNGEPVTADVLSASSLVAVVGGVPVSGTALNVAIARAGQPTASAWVPVLPGGTVATSRNPQVADYSISLPQGASVAVDFGADTRYGQSTWAVAAPAGGGVVHVLVAGMKEFSAYHLRGRIMLGDGSVILDGDKVFATGGMDPSVKPSVTSGLQVPAPAGSGIEMFDFTTSTTQTSVVATDLNGNIIWYYDPGVAGTYVFPIRALPNGDMLVSIAAPQSGFGTSNEIREVDLAGNTVRSVNFSNVASALAAQGYSLNLGGFHHDVIALPNGHWVTLAYEFRTFQNLPNTSGPTTVRGDAIIDLDTNGQPVWV
ncbi:MAG TPA: aryl-sulfate sulfotransferase, partial [Terriglobales bacterium]|nr:aryl-sulfate sulfotransferase [Terriglobales bacterium]